MNPSWIRLEYNGNHQIMEAVFRTGKSSDFFDLFRPNTCSFQWETTGYHRKIRHFSGLKYCFRFSSIFVFFLHPFRQDPLVPRYRNLLSGKSFEPHFEKNIFLVRFCACWLGIGRKIPLADTISRFSSRMLDI